MSKKMQKAKSSRMEVKSFTAFWALAVYLLWPALIVPVTLAIYLFTPNFTNHTPGYLYWASPYNKLIFVAVFSIATGVVQSWTFRRFLNLNIADWTIVSIIGGLAGSLVMWILRLQSPFEMFSWFIGISIAQYWLLRSRTKNAWLWILAHLCLSFFFPIYAQNGVLVVVNWLTAATAYALGTLLVLHELRKEGLGS
jgi:hypothetical protein